MDATILSASSDLLIEQLLSAKLNDDEIAIGLSSKSGTITADLLWDEYNTEQMLSLRYHEDGHFDLFYSYYDDDKEGYVTVVHDLNDDQIHSLPDGLAPVMARALATGKPISVRGNQLT